jgi:peptide/nickel transport system ATP-binding protein
VSTAAAGTARAIGVDHVPTLLDVQDLRIAFPDGAGGRIHPVDGVSFTLARGEMLALVGESGCGKSLTSLALLRLVPPPGRIEAGSRLRLGDTDVLALEGEALRQIRGRRIGMIFQDPMTSLNPVFTVGDQITEGMHAHFKVSKKEARERALALLTEVGIPDPAARFDAYPHQLSGGMRQRVMIAIALAAEPEILIADEPTTALDVTVQAQILEVLDRLRETRGMAILLITHDLGVVAGRADRTAVMYAGQIVEAAPTPELFARPQHPYTLGLFGSVPRLTGPRERLTPIKGSVPPPAAWPTGCRFRTRCPIVHPKSAEMPPLLPAGPDHRSRCWLAQDAARAGDATTANAASAPA